MRYLKPSGTLIKINGKTYCLKFTLDIIAELQGRANIPLPELMHMTVEKKYRNDAIEVLLKYLVGKNIKVNENELDYYSTVLLETYIDQLKSKPYEGEQKGEPNDKYEFINVERLFYIAKTVLNMSEEEAWGSTVGAINTLHKEHILYNGWVKEDKEVDIMDAEG